MARAVVGLVGALVTGTTLLGQIERAMNRMYGIERDRPTLRKYGRAFVLAISAGLVSVTGFVMMTLGQAVGGRSKALSPPTSGRSSDGHSRSPC